MTLCSKTRRTESNLPMKWLMYWLFLCSLNTYAASRLYQSHDEIYELVHAFIKQQYKPDQDIVIKLGTLDKRLRLIDCHNGLEAFWPEGSNKIGKVSIGIACTQAPNWKIYTSANIREFKHIYTIKQAIQRGMILNMADLQLERREISAARNGFLTDLSPYEGYIVKKSYQTGEILSAKYLTPPKLIKRGNKVTLLARSKGVEVRMKGTAMSDGAAGDIIKIRNLSSKKIVDAKVIAENLALVHM